MRTSDRDTIVAVATAPGEAAIGLIRMSGPESVQVASGCFRGRVRLEDAGDRKLLLGFFVVEGQDLDQVLASVMRAPGSYTGQDMVEFNCHGGPLLLRRAVRALVGAGARLAERGEFTKRAFLNGKMDLSQAEAVAAMISARSDLGLSSAFFQLRGGLRRQFEGMAERLREALVLLEAGLDFSDDVEIDFGIVRQQIDLVLARVGGLVRSYQMGKVMREGALVTLAGRPNVGKSSLLNRFLEEERAIVTDIPGTTRDTIEESVNLDGIAVTLVDTAGIRQSGDAVEMAGTRRSQQFIDVAERVLLVVDGARPPVQEDFSVLGVLDRSQGFLVVNKVDLGVHEAWDRVTVNADSVRVSAKTGEGIERLRMRLRGSLLGGVGVSGDVVTHERHLIALRGAQRALFQAVEGLSEAVPAELVAMECRLALDALSGIVGETTADDILDRIFGSFCIGK